MHRLEMTTRPYDLALIGAGGAGMCVLHALHEAGVLHRLRVLVLEPLVKKQNDRTWCFWAKPNDPLLQAFGKSCSHQWTTARAGGRTQALAPYIYYQIRSSDLYAQVQEEMQAYPGVEWRQEAVSTLSSSPEQMVLQTDQASYASRLVFDSRITPDQFQADGLWQSFTGLRIRLHRPQFDPQQLDLMRFDIPQASSTQFLYILPSSPTEALVELTRFDRRLLDPAEAWAFLHDWCGQQFGGFEIEEVENGRIPMQQLPVGPRHHAPGQRHIPIGTAAGAVKSSTGYALKNMYEHAQALTVALDKGSPLPAIQQAPRFAFYDRLLLDILRRQPERGSAIFTRLFQHVPIPQVFRFLEEKSSLPQELPILAALPLPTFLAALRRAMGPSILLMLLLLVCLLLQMLAPDSLSIVAPLLLVGGLLFPGIPHGAVDHLLAGQPQPLPRFIGYYLLVMLLVVALWWIFPALGLTGFLLYSAWHFGQTDFRHWELPQGGRSFLYGSALLLFLLSSHPTALTYYLNALAVPLPALPFTALAGGSAGLLLLGLAWIPRQHRPSYAFTLLILFAGAALPLLLAFGFYFIGLHSARGWQHLTTQLALSNRQLLRQALPFSAAAWLMFLGLGLATRWYPISFEGWIPAFFVFLSAISAPHVLQMHRFYRRWRP